MIALLEAFIVASWLYSLVAWFLTYLFFRKRSVPDAACAPPVSILKPIRGLDAGLFENLASFCQQDYPEFELVLGVADPVDPAIPIIERVRRAFPASNIRISVAETMGANHKASLLHHVVAQASHEILVISDSDMRVTPDYLRRVVAPLADPDIGLVTCPYRGAEPHSLAARLEALHMGATFLPAVLVARQFLAMRFALGATMALRRSDLNRLGGFAILADYLADDYQLGARVAALGLRVHLSDYVIACVLGATSFKEEWLREVRWSRTNRVCRPVEYPIMLLMFSTPLALVLALASHFIAPALMVVLSSMLLRWLMAWAVSGYTGDREVRRAIVWLPVRDLLSAAVWLAGLVGRHVTWRGEKFLLHSDGRLEALAPRVEVEEERTW
jgi:ceramide glucosyltransferase